MSDCKCQKSKTHSFLILFTLLSVFLHDCVSSENFKVMEKHFNYIETKCR